MSSGHWWCGSSTAAMAAMTCEAADAARFSFDARVASVTCLTCVLASAARFSQRASLSCCLWMSYNKALDSKFKIC